MLVTCSPYVELLSALYFSMVIDNLFMRPIWEIDYFREIRRHAAIFSSWVEKKQRTLVLKTAKQGLKRAKAMSRLRGKIMFGMCVMVVFVSVTKDQMLHYGIPYKEVLVALSSVSVFSFMLSYLFYRRSSFLLVVLSALVVSKCLMSGGVLDEYALFHTLTLSITRADVSIARISFLILLTIPVVWHFLYSTVLMSTYAKFLQLSAVRERRLRLMMRTAVNASEAKFLPRQYQMTYAEFAMDFNTEWYKEVIEKRLLYNTRPSVLRFLYLLCITPEARAKNCKYFKRLWTRAEHYGKLVVLLCSHVANLLIQKLMCWGEAYVRSYIANPPYIQS